MKPTSAAPIDLSSEAVLELEELKQGIRDDAPALYSLFEFLKTPAPAFNGQNSVSMLGDVRAHALFRESLSDPKITGAKLSEFTRAVEKYLAELEAGVKAKNRAKIDSAKRFCLLLSENLISREIEDLYQRRESGDSRYIYHESIR